jgi:hypothetical protein
MTNAPSKLRAREAALQLLNSSARVCLRCTIIGLVYSQSELITIKLKKLNYILFVGFEVLTAVVLLRP